MKGEHFRLRMLWVERMLARFQENLENLSAARAYRT